MQEVGGGLKPHPPSPPQDIPGVNIRAKADTTEQGRIFFPLSITYPILTVIMYDTHNIDIMI